MTQLASKTIEAHEPDPHSRGTLAIWSAVLGVPIVWALHLNLNYSIIEKLCQTRHTMWMHTISLICLVLVTAGTFLAWQEFHELPACATSDPEPERIERTRFVSALGILSGALFFVVIVATSLAQFFFDPCWQ
jgi:hypothetical protein